MPSYPRLAFLLLTFLQCVSVVNSKGLPANIPLKDWSLDNEHVNVSVECLRKIVTLRQSSEDEIA